MKIDVVETAQLLKQADRILILSHKHPDGDTLGSAYGLYHALKQMGKTVSCACHDIVPSSFAYLAKGYKQLAFEPSMIVTVDIADTQLFGAKLERYIGHVDLCIDHHVSNSLYANKTFLVDSASATCEAMFDVINQMGVTIDKKIASCLYTGIVTDTGCFKFSNTTSKTHCVAGSLIDSGANYAKINRDIFDTKSRARLMIEQMVLNTIEFFFDEKCAVIIITQEMLRKTGVDESELDDVSGIPRSIAGVEVGITIREKTDGVHKASVRTSQFVNASQVCKTLGGGGHVRAAGCAIKGTLQEVKERILAAVGTEIDLTEQD